MRIKDTATELWNHLYQLTREPYAEVHTVAQEGGLGYGYSGLSLL